jgi:N-acetylglucosaminyldiphosphoundecaprenol N-acetyl-beta-D-mannosaminyltransferase
VATQEIAIGFYGASVETLEQLIATLKRKYPILNIAYSYSPPFLAMTVEEDEAIIRTVNSSEAKILFVGLGCPKQERWMAAHRGKIQSVMLGVGAAFDIHAGNKRQAPLWMQRSGLEWLFRFSQEPTRLWRRYVYHNPRFLILAIMQLAGLARF